MEKKENGRAAMRKALNRIFEQHARTRVNGNVASHSTATTNGSNISTCFNDLWELGHKIENPEKLNSGHVKALCEHWHAKGIAVSTMQARLSSLRIFAGWIGKRTVVGNLPSFLPQVDPKLLRVVKTAKSSKSWTENGIDVIAKIKEADELDPIFGRMLRMDLAFGLRRMEVLQLKPYKSDKGDKLRVYEAKNGRQRDVDVATGEQRQVLDFVKSKLKNKLDHMGWTQTKRGAVATLEYNIQRYHKCMAAIGITRADGGVTGHGLRAQFAENAALIAGMIPPTLGGSAGQMSKGDLDVTRAQVSELLGHSRVSVTGSYYGSFGRDVTPDAADRCKTNIEQALAYCHPGVTRSVGEDRLADCLQMVKELNALDIDITVRQVQMLWEIHSERFAVYWKKPQTGNAESIETAALKLLKQEGGNKAVA